MHLREKVVAYFISYSILFPSWCIQFNWSDKFGNWSDICLIHHWRIQRKSTNSNRTYCEFQTISNMHILCTDSSRIDVMYVFPNPCEMSNTHTRNIHLHSSLLVRSPYIRLAYACSLLSHFLARLPSFLLLTFYRIHWYTWLIHSSVCSCQNTPNMKPTSH